MSGIYGIINLKGNPVDKSQMDKMEDLLIHRGVDGKAQWIDDTVGLGHLKLEITPESEYERLPLEYKQWVITADARIDNRDELHIPLSISEEEQPFIPDTTYIVKAYEKWGKDCVKHLIGDFAFAIWDKVEKTLFCARDHIGIKPFFYLKTEDKFIFASELKTIVELREIPIELNESKLQDWLYFIQDLNNPSETLFDNIYRLEQAHFGLLTISSFHSFKYWQLQYKKEINLNNDAEYITQFRNLIIQAVECRMRTKYLIGVTLSGGLDSSSIACIAAQKLAKENKQLYSVSSILPDNWSGKETDERCYIEKVLTQEKNINGYFVKSENCNFLENLKIFIRNFFFPTNPFYYKDVEISKVFKKQNVRLVLNGFAGDMAASHKANRLFLFFILEGKFVNAFNLLKLRRNIENINFLKLLLSESKFFVKYILQKILVKLNIINYTNKNNFINCSYLTESLTKNRQILINSSSINIRDNIAAAFSRSITHFEEFNIHNATFQCEELIPFTDIRILNFLMNMPLQYFQLGGWERGLIRFSMNKILPEEIQFRKDKKPYVPHYFELIKKEKKSIKSYLNKNKELDKFFNFARLTLAFDLKKNHDKIIKAKTFLIIIIFLNIFFKKNY